MVGARGAEKLTFRPPRGRPSLGRTLLSITAPGPFAASGLVGGSKAEAPRGEFFSLTLTVVTALFSNRISFFPSS